MQTKTKRITWDDLAAHEPALTDLLNEARSVKDDDPTFSCRCIAFVEGTREKPSFKRRLYDLVGFGAKHRGPIMTSCEAWDLTVETVHGALPGCHNCGCVDWNGNFV